MVTRIDSNKLRLGMFIHNLGGSWMTHPFLRKSFLLKNAEDISRILEAGINEVWIDETKGESVAAEPPNYPNTLIRNCCHRSNKNCQEKNGKFRFNGS